MVGAALAAQAMADAPAAAVDLAKLENKPLYEFSEAEVGAYLGQLQATEPSLRKRIVKLARKNLGQPYDLYLLGEMPFETYDPQPIYCLTKSDCVVFAEHTYAMALTERLARVHPDAAADSLPRWPDGRRHAQPLHRVRLGQVESLVGA